MQPSLSNSWRLRSIKWRLHINTQRIYNNGPIKILSAKIVVKDAYCHILSMYFPF
jgi:hypothetical protein